MLAILLKQGHGTAGRDAGHHERRGVAATAATGTYQEGGARTSGPGNEHGNHEQENAGPAVHGRPSRGGLPVS